MGPSRPAHALTQPRGRHACPFYRIVSSRGQEVGRGYLLSLGVSEVCGLFCCFFILTLGTVCMSKVLILIF